MKNIYKSILLFSAVLFCFADCGEKDPLTNRTSNADLSSVSDDVSVDSTSEASSFAEVIMIDDLKNYSFDFTEDDLRLQSFLRDNWDMAFLLARTYIDGGIGSGENDLNVDNEHKSRYFLKCEKYDLPYDIVSDSCFENAEEYQALLEKYFFSDCLKNNIFITKADIADLENDCISIREDSSFDEPPLIEINGRLYHAACCMGTPFVPCSYMAKVITETDNEIVFSYLCSVYGEVTAGKGVLKREDGVWKFGWFDISQPMELLDIYKVWGI